MNALSSLYPEIRDRVSKGEFSQYAILNIAITNGNNELLLQYIDHIRQHNQNMLYHDFPNSGFDLFVPAETVFDTPFVSKMVNLQVKAEMIYYSFPSNKSEYSAYLIHPRSSISKTPLMLANHTGIIDSGYRGNLIAALRCLLCPNITDPYTVEKYTRLLQICHPSLCRIFVNIVNEEDLTSTERGQNGFGSTGK